MTLHSKHPDFAHDGPPAAPAFGTYAQIEAQATEKAIREGVDVHIYRTKSGRFTLIKPADDGIRKTEPHGTIAAPMAEVQRTGNLNATPQYEGEHGCRTYVGTLPTGHVCMKPETVIHDGRKYCDEHRPEESRPMAEIQETAQWYTVNSGMDEIRAVIRETTQGTGRSGMNWNRLPMLTKDALRREFYRIRSIGEAIDQENQARERLRNGEPRLTADEPEETNPASATSEANREQEQRVGLRIAEVSQLSPAPGVFVRLPNRFQQHWGDGAAAKNKAIQELEDATANVANAADTLFQEWEACLPATVTLEDLEELAEAIATRRAKQEAFLRAMANQPPQSEPKTEAETVAAYDRANQQTLD